MFDWSNQPQVISYQLSAFSNHSGGGLTADG